MFKIILNYVKGLLPPENKKTSLAYDLVLFFKKDSGVIYFISLIMGLSLLPETKIFSANGFSPLLIIIVVLFIFLMWILFSMLLYLVNSMNNIGKLKDSKLLKYSKVAILAVFILLILMCLIYSFQFILLITGSLIIFSAVFFGVPIIESSYKSSVYLKNKPGNLFYIIMPLVIIADGSPYGADLVIIWAMVLLGFFLYNIISAEDEYKTEEEKNEERYEKIRIDLANIRNLLEWLIDDFNSEIKEYIRADEIVYSSDLYFLNKKLKYLELLIEKLKDIDNSSSISQEDEDLFKVFIPQANMFIDNASKELEIVNNTLKLVNSKY